MKSEMLSRDDITRIMGRFGGRPGNEAAIDAALLAGRRRGAFRKVAYLWRALLFGYPLSEGDRRTALVVAFIVLEGGGVALWDGQKKRVVDTLLRVSKENISDIRRIERLVRYAVEGR